MTKFQVSREFSSRRSTFWKFRAGSSLEPLPHSALRCASRGAPKSRPRPHGTPLRAHPLARPPAHKNRARAASPRATGRTEGPFFAQELRFFGLRGPLRPGAAALRALLPPPSSVAPWEWAPERPLGGLAMEPFGVRLCRGLPQEPSLPNPWGPALWRQRVFMGPIRANSAVS